MIGPGTGVRVYLACGATDMRKSITGLSVLVQDHLLQKPSSGAVFAFRGRKGDRLKLLYWDETGYAVWYKRLEEGTFRFPAATGDTPGVAIRAADLTMLLDGVELGSVKRRKRYRRPEPAATTH